MPLEFIPLLDPPESFQVFQSEEAGLFSQVRVLT